MSTFNGFGTLYYGWRHHADGTATATKWLSAFYIPLVPLQRNTLKVSTNFDNDPIHVKAIGGGAFGFVASQANQFSVVGTSHLDVAEVAVTLLKTYVLLPFLMIWPLALTIAVSKAFGPFPDSQIGSVIGMAASALTLFSVFAWPIWAIRRSRGKRA
jgi:hypothetical protein